MEFLWTDVACSAGDGGHNGRLPGPIERFGPPYDGRRCRAGTASLRRADNRVRSGVHICGGPVERRYIEAQKLWLAARPGKAGKPLAAVNIRHRLGLLRTVFEWLRNWDYDDAPNQTLIVPGDFPQADEPLPKFLADQTMEKLKAALASDPDPRRRLMVEILALFRG
jgi:integrase